MSQIVYKDLDKKVIGLKDFRNNITEIYSKAINNFAYVLTGNIRTGSKTVSIISTDLLKSILENYKFNPIINFDKATNQYEIIIEEIGANGCGDKTEDAVEMIVDNVLALTEDYFEQIELYMRIDEMKVQFPYFLRIKNCNSTEELLKTLGIDNKR